MNRSIANGRPVPLQKRALPPTRQRLNVGAVCNQAESAAVAGYLPEPVTAGTSA